MAQFLQVPAKDLIDSLERISVQRRNHDVCKRTRFLFHHKVVKEGCKNCDKLIAYTRLLAAGLILNLSRLQKLSR